MTVCAVDPEITVYIGVGGDAGYLGVPGTQPPIGTPGVWWNALSFPDWSMRYSYAPPSAFIPGNTMLAAVVDSSTLNMVIAAIGSDVETLEIEKALVSLALGQLGSSVHIRVGPIGTGTIVGNWEADPSVPKWGQITPARYGLFVAEASVSIPVNPRIDYAD